MQDNMDQEARRGQACQMMGKPFLSYVTAILAHAGQAGSCTS